MGYAIISDSYMGKNGKIFHICECNLELPKTIIKPDGCILYNKLLKIHSKTECECNIRKHVHYLHKFSFPYFFNNEEREAICYENRYSTVIYSEDEYVVSILAWKLYHIMCKKCYEKHIVNRNIFE